MPLKNVCVAPAKLGRNTSGNAILNINPAATIAADPRTPVPAVIAADLLMPDPAAITAPKVALVVKQASAEAVPSAASS